MPRLGQQFRRPWWWAAIVLTLIAGAGLLWEKSRLSGNSGTQLDSAYSQGDWEKTSALARERLKESPHDVRALRLAARAAARQDQDQKSIAIYERLDTGSKEAEDFFLLGRAFVRSGKIDRAFKAFEAAREKESGSPGGIGWPGRAVSAIGPQRRGRGLHPAAGTATPVGGAGPTLAGDCPISKPRPRGRRGGIAAVGGTRSRRARRRPSSGRGNQKVAGSLVAGGRSARESTNGSGDGPGSGSGPGSLVAAQPLLHSGEGVEASRRGARTAAELPRRPPPDARTGSPCGGGSVRRLPS